MIYDSPANTIFSLAVYDGELYAGSSTGGIIYKYNSTDWNLIYDSPEGTIYSLNLYDRKLYAGSGARGFLYTFGNNPTISSSKSEWNNIWNHVAVVSNYSGLFMYINGVLESFLSADNRINNSILPLFIGKTYGNKIFSGNLDELAVYNRTLYENEILEHYKRGALRLNVSYRSCDDNLCSGESWSLQYENSSFVELLADSNKYFQYKFNFYTYDLNYTPVLNNASVYYEMN